MKTILSLGLLLSISLFAQEAPTVPPTNPSTTSSTSEANSDRHEGKLIYRVSPVYPPEAMQKRIEGSVELSATIQKDGTLRDITVRSGDPLLAPAAIDAVKQWKYDPYTLHGQPVEVDTAIKINFLLPPRVRVSQAVMQAFLKKKVTPDYPQEARIAHLQGAVVMAVLIDKEGRVEWVKLVSGHPLIAPAAVEAVRHWEYKPYLLNGQPVEVESQVTVNFTLSPY